MKLNKEQEEIIESIENKVIINGQWYVSLMDWIKVHGLDMQKQKIYKGIKDAGIKIDLMKTGNVNPITKSPCKINVYCVNDDNFEKFLECIAPIVIPDYEENTWLSGIELNSIFNKCESWSYKTARRHNFKKNKKGQYKLSDFVGLMKK